MIIKDSNKHPSGQGIFIWLARNWRVIFLILCFGASFFLGYLFKRKGTFGYIIKPALYKLIEFKKTFKGMTSNPELLNIDIKYLDYQKLAYKRSEALRLGHLFKDSDDFVPAVIHWKDKAYKVELRLKGDHTDHLTSDQWSFRIKVKGDNTILGMKEFSIQHPMTRQYLNEWLYHQALKREGILPVTYKFIECNINGKKVIYAFEGHFDKNLIESNNMREAPIIRFSEDDMWVKWYRWIMLGGKTPAPDDWYLSSDIDGFQDNKIFSNKLLYSQYIKAKDLLEAFRRGLLKTSDVFDVKKLAKFFALTELFGAEHSAWWHNTRFYYNPITSKLEPIGSDADVGPINNICPVFAENPNCIYYKTIFSDMIFYREYLKALEEVSQQNYLDNFFNEIKDALDNNLNIIYKSFPYYEFDKNVLYKNRAIIKEILTPAKGILAYFKEMLQGRINISIGNIQILPIEVLSLSRNGHILCELQEPAILPGKRSFEIVNYINTAFFLDADFIWDDSYSKELEVNYRVLGTTQIKSEKVIPWNYISKDFLKGDAIRQKPNFKDFNFVDVDEVNGIIFLKTGDWSIDKDFIVPEGYRILCGEGTKLTLLNSSMLISFSPLEFIGSEDNPIYISSEDLTGQGIVVINSKSQSILERVILKNLTYPKRSGWELTGAITFYESPVKITNCQFLNNRSEDNLNIVRSNFSIDKCSFVHTFADAFDSDFSTGEINNSNFIHCGNDAIDVSGGLVQLNNIKIDETGDKGLSVGERSQVIAQDIEIKKVNIAAASKDESELTINNIKVSDCINGLAAYQKKPEYGPAKIKAKNIKFQNVQKETMCQNGSSISIDDKESPQEEVNVDKLY